MLTRQLQEKDAVLIDMTQTVQQAKSEIARTRADCRREVESLLANHTSELDRLKAKIANLETELDLVRTAVQQRGESLEESSRHLEASKTRLHKMIQNALLPRDENDTDSDAIIEIRAGTGGSEANIFAGTFQHSTNLSV